MTQQDSNATGRHLVITVHGIRTFGQWQERLEALVTSETPNIEVHNYKYGYFSIVAFLVPFLRWFVTRNFRRDMMRIVKRRNWDRIDIVAHSFGTHLVAWGLHGIKSDQRPRIHTIILAGSVLRERFRWEDLIGDGVGRLVNDCGIYDKILVLNHFLVPGLAGMAGRVGFAGMTGADFRNRLFAFGHSGYFQKHGKPDDTFMREYWLPILIGEGPVRPFDDPRRATAVSGLQIFLLNNAEPLKLVMYGTPLVLFILWINGLRLEAVAQRKVARANESRALAALSETASSQGRYVDAVKLALAAWPRSPDGDRPKLRATVNALGRAQPLQKQTIPSLRHEGIVLGAAFNGDGSRILTWSEDGTARLWDAASGEQVLPPLRHEGAVGGAAFNGDGSRLLTWSDDGTRACGTPSPARRSWRHCITRAPSLAPLSAVT
jgi:hypothetical protein